MGGFVPELGGHDVASSFPPLQQLTMAREQISSSRIYNAEGRRLLEGEEDSDRKGG
jgi:hypothetical protein